MPQIQPAERVSHADLATAVLARGSGSKPQASLFASGSEVEIALAARKLLSEKGIEARVVFGAVARTVPATERVRRRVLGSVPIKVSVAAAVRFGRDAVIGPDGIFVGMKSFGASASYKDLYNYFGITPETVFEEVSRALSACNGEAARKKPQSINTVSAANHLAVGRFPVNLHQVVN